MIAAIHQPNYLPYLGFFHKLAQADVFILLDQVEFVDRLFQQRNKIKTPQGAKWLTVPVHHAYADRPPISAIEIAVDHEPKWGLRHWDTLRFAYSKAPHFKEHAEWLQEVYCARQWTKLADLSEFIIRRVATILGLESKIIRGSELGVSGHRSDLLAGLCQAVGASEYLSGATGHEYLDPAVFQGAGVGLRYQEFHHPVYRQLHGDFVANLCVLDLLFNEGPNSSALIRSASPVHA